MTKRKPFADLIRSFTQERLQMVELRKTQLLNDQTAQPSS